MNIEFLDSATEEFLRAVQFYQGQQRGLGSRLIEDLEGVTELLRETPRAGAPFVDKTRRFPLQHFPFNVVYFIDDETIVIVAVAHQRRKPGYWRSRLEPVE